MCLKLRRKIEKLLLEANENSVDAFLVGAIIFKNSKILIIKRSESETFLPGLLEIPSGHVENNENLIECLRREVKEETNLNICNKIKFINYFDYMSCSSKKKRQFNFEVDFIGEVHLNAEEHSSYSWISKNEIQHIHNMSIETKEIILRAFRVKNK